MFLIAYRQTSFSKIIELVLEKRTETDYSWAVWLQSYHVRKYDKTNMEASQWQCEVKDLVAIRLLLMFETFLQEHPFFYSFLLSRIDEEV